MYLLLLGIYYISDRFGSYAGGRLITLHGISNIICIYIYIYIYIILLLLLLLMFICLDFAKDQFNRDDPNIGNRVVFTDGTDNITCEVVTYYTTTRRIKCIMG